MRCSKLSIIFLWYVLKYKYPHMFIPKEKIDKATPAKIRPITLG